MSVPAATSVEIERDSCKTRSIPMLGLLLIVALGMIIRWLASLDNFWFDEVWSWKLATAAESYWKIATAIRHDNNHILNSWVIHALPQNAHWTIDRLPAVFAGTIAVVLAGFCGFRRSTIEGVLTALLMSSSFVMIQYSSEARGYAYLLLFLSVCIWLMGRADDRYRPYEELLFAVSASLGFLAHISFASAYIGLACWSIAMLVKRQVPRSRWIASLLRLHALPILTLATFLYFNTANFVIGGGNQNPLREVLIQTGSLVVGGPEHGGVAVISAIISALAVLISAAMLIRQRDGLGFYVAGSSLTLLIVVCVARPDVIYVRYFLVLIAGALLSIGHLLAFLWTAGGWRRMAAGSAVLLALGGNFVHIRNLLMIGRGGYEAAVTLMNDASLAEITVGSDHDFRNPMLLNFYHQRIDRPKPMTYFKNGQWPVTGPEWVILHTFDSEQVPLPTLKDGGGNNYRMIRDYPYAGLSGWRWVLYRNERNHLPADRTSAPSKESLSNVGQER